MSLAKLALAALLIAPMGAVAQPAPTAPKLPEQAINCDALNKTTMICVLNETGEAITKITCGTKGMFESVTDLSIPLGVIRPEQMTIVDFPAGKCAKHLVVFTRSGHQHPFDGFDTTSNTKLVVDAN